MVGRHNALGCDWGRIRIFRRRNDAGFLGGAKVACDLPPPYQRNFPQFRHPITSHNSAILSRPLTTYKASGNETALALITSASPLA